MGTLFIEPFGGIAGDMFLAALLDLKDSRFDRAELERVARSLVPGEFRLSTEIAWRGSLSGLCLTVETLESARPPARHLSDCVALIEASVLSTAARTRAAAVFQRIARAEATVHGCTIDEIHFHEVGAVDALIDVCGALHALDRLEITRCAASAPLLGSGTVHCAHGEMPVPAPGTAEILRGLPTQMGGGPGERTTPTGAALLAELATPFEAPAEFSATSIGYGAGHKTFASGPPNILRVQLGSAARKSASAPVWLLEVNLDDQTGEELAFLAERLRASGALDVWTTAVQMKKGRPAVVVSALCRAELRAALERELFAHSTTLGCRWIACERSEQGRETLEVELFGERVRVKCRTGALSPSALDCSAEHDDLAALSRKTGKSLRELEGFVWAELVAQRGKRPALRPGHA